MRVYGSQCDLCGTVMLRGPGDADLCAGCTSNLERAPR